MKLVMTKKVPEKVRYGFVASPVGRLVVGVTDKGEICRVAFLNKRAVGDVVAEWRDAWKKTVFVSDKKVGAKLGAVTKMPVMLVGTDFQQSVWRLMAKIPSGSVTTYGEMAVALGKPNAARAVGGACGKNPVPYYVPCHRVIAGDGSLGGFSGGLGVKEKLLKVEGWLR